MRVVNPNAAGIDIGSEAHYVAVPPDRDPETVRSFKCFTADLNRLADWLEQCGIETVAMESTSVYWIPLYQIVEARGFEVILVNARHVKNVPGQKIEACLGTFESKVDPAQKTLPPYKHGKKKPHGNQPDLDLRNPLYRMIGLDLIAIDGFDVLALQTIISEVGLDATKWPMSSP